MSKLSPRESGKLIAANSKHVTVHRNSTAAKEIFQRMKEQKYSRSLWKQWPLHPKNLTKETVDWIFVVDSLNFSFWLAGEKQFQLEYNEKVYEDYEALCAAINRALDINCVKYNNIVKKFETTVGAQIIALLDEIAS